MKLKDITSIKTGLNSSRMNDPTINYYSSNDIEFDLSHIVDSKIVNDEKYSVLDEYRAKQGSVVQSLISQETAQISAHNSGKILNQNFITFDFDDEKLDAKYLCYLLNESDEVKRQKYAVSQGSIVRKATPAMIKEFKVNLPDIQLQKDIGQVYALTLEKRRIVTEKLNIEEQLVFTEIKQLLKKGR
ncbi:restriction endonuclease subunit S [Companilactobacillus furfuricola]|uniref:restriction endonuclease subunit S n=1 Tax=Companilactobacillus furfuricola TaxID=1462575 RepID=UPI000F7B368D|nr:restriction endonuclease subunit S [Companilactobacillus furfuricola]